MVGRGVGTVLDPNIAVARCNVSRAHWATVTDPPGADPHRSFELRSQHELLPRSVRLASSTPKPAVAKRFSSTGPCDYEDLVRRP